MQVWRSAAALALAAIIGPLSARAAATCPIGAGFDYLGTQVLQADAGRPWLFVTKEKLVDADGAPNAYSPLDLGGGCPHAGVGLDCPDSAGYPDADWWPDVLARDPDNPDQAYVQQHGPYRGFFVSKTSLRNPAYAGVLSPASYVDADRIPYLVLPAPLYASDGMGRPGDLGYAVDLETGAATPFVVADEGPVEPLGEASIAFWRGLTSVAPNARDGAGLPAGDVAVLVFPGSAAAASLGWPIGLDRLGAQAGRLLQAFGGEAALKACAELARNAPEAGSEAGLDD